MLISQPLLYSYLQNKYIFLKSVNNLHFFLKGDLTGLCTLHYCVTWRCFVCGEHAGGPWHAARSNTAADSSCQNQSIVVFWSLLRFVGCDVLCLRCFPEKRAKMLECKMKRDKPSTNREEIPAVWCTVGALELHVHGLNTSIIHLRSLTSVFAGRSCYILLSVLLLCKKKKSNNIDIKHTQTNLILVCFSCPLLWYYSC